MVRIRIGVMVRVRIRVSDYGFIKVTCCIKDAVISSLVLGDVGIVGALILRGRIMRSPPFKINSLATSMSCDNLDFSGVIPSAWKLN